MAAGGGTAPRRRRERGRLLSVLAVVEPNTLVGIELRQQLRQRRRLWDEVRLLSVECSDETATLSEFDGAALVQPLTADRLAGVDLIFACGGFDPEEPAWAGAGGATTILVQPATPPAEGVTVVSGVNLEAARPGGLLVSPHPAVVLLGLLLAPLRALGLADAAAWLVQPATMRGRAGLDELMDQTRALLAFRDGAENAVFGHQLAFNLLPAAGATPPLARALTALLGGRVTAALEIVQGAVFHSFAASVLVTFGQDPGHAAVTAALAEGPWLHPAEEPAGLGPIAAADSDRVLVGEVTAAADRPSAYWLRAAMDNLTRGGALNALDVAAAVLA